MKASAKIPERTLLHANLHSVPADWRIEYLGNIATTQYGLSTQTSNDGETPIIGMQDIVDGYVRFSQTACVSLREEEIEKYALHERDILFNRTNSRALVGKTGIVDLSPASPIVFASYLVRIRADEAEVDARFLNYFMNSFSSQKQLSALATLGVSQANINPSDLRSRLLMPIPPLEQQRGIADVLRVWDRGIQEVESAIHQETELKRGLAQQLLTGKRRFPEFTREWRTHRIGDLLQEVKRYVEWNDGDTYKLVGIRRRSGGFFFRGAIRGKAIKTKIMKTTHASDFVIARMQVVHGAMAMTPELYDSAHVSDSYMTFVARDPSVLHMPFFDHLSRTPMMRHKALLSSYGVVIEKMTFNSAWFLKEEVRIPPTMNEQRRVVSLLDGCDRGIELLHLKLDLLKRQKRGLMQKLLTGEVRVPAGGE